MSIIKPFKRDDNGLIPGIDYILTDEGLIDWRAVIPNKFFYIKNDQRSRVRIEKKYGKSIKDIDITNDKVSDSDLIITLGGIKYVAKVRGILSVSENIKESNEDYCSVTCNIIFTPNFETEMNAVPFSASASAHRNNTTDFYQKYLVEAASNRAFVRCVRNFLNINIVSKEELGEIDNNNSGEDDILSNSPSDSQVSILETIMKKKKMDFKQLKMKLSKEKFFDGVENITSVREIPKAKMFTLIERISNFNPEEKATDA